MKLYSSPISRAGTFVCPVILATENQLTEQNLAGILDLVNKIARSKLPGHHRQTTGDVVQTVTLNLWRWQHRKIAETSAGCRTNKTSPEPAQSVTAGKKEDTLTHEAWRKIAARTSINEINSYYAHKQHREVALCPENSGGELPQLFAYYGSCRIEGETETETASLLKFVWSQMPTLSLRERYCFLLSRDELIDDLIGHGICRLADIAGYLEMSRADFVQVLEQLPISDETLKELIERQTGAAITLKQIWTTRSKARRKLADKLAPST